MFGSMLPAHANDAVATFMPRPEVHQPINGNLRVVSVLSASGEVVDGTDFSVWREQPDAYGKMRQTLMAQAGPQAQADFELTPGRYRLQARNDTVVVEQTIDVPLRGALDTEVDLNAGRLLLTAVMDQAGLPAEAAWFRILRRETDSYGKPTLVQLAGRGYAQQAEFLLPAGEYLAETRFGDASVRVPVSVTPGGTSEHTLQLDAGRLHLGASLDGDGEPVDGVSYAITGLAPDNTGTNLELAEQAVATPLVVILPRGQYRVSARLDRATAERDIRIDAGEDTGAHLALEAGELLVHASLAGQSDSLLDTLFDIAPVEATTAPSGSGARGPDHRARFIVPAGRHRVFAKHGESTGEKVVEVAPGSSQTVSVDLDAGRISLQFQPEADQPAFPYTWFSVYRIEHDAQGRARRQRVYNEGYFASTEVVLPAGEYIAFARSDQHHGEARFSVTPGMNGKVDLVAASASRVPGRVGMTARSDR
ncbi:MAG: hypothetical protein KDI82_10255 [Gammaproteobacteria bacterium]|nr:hypothetical protein [Gammaproteobacteria bacterium]